MQYEEIFAFEDTGDKMPSHIAGGTGDRDSKDV